MVIRHTKIEEIDKLLEIYDAAKVFMANSNNATQWKSTYPERELLMSDIENYHSYVCVDEGQIVATFCFFIGDEPAYRKIYNGAWLNSDECGFIKRLAVGVRNKGYASACMNWCLKQIGNVKIITHEDNIPMQKAILKAGFKYCGIVKQPDGTERFAYQYVS